MEEIWKPIDGWEGLYEISNYGRVKSLARVVYRGDPVIKQHRKERILKPYYNWCGRQLIGLVRDGEGQKTVQISRLVANTFIDNPENLPDLNHKDGDPTNNRIDNLEWTTKSDNMKHAWKNGLKEHYTTHLSNNDIKKMRLFKQAGMPSKLIAEVFNCSYT
jgi:hypothetical protein